MEASMGHQAAVSASSSSAAEAGTSILHTYMARRSSEGFPPRPGTPEYDAYRQKMDAEVIRDKSKDPPKPKTDPGIAGFPK
jgi:hypothetical protein